MDSSAVWLCHRLRSVAKLFRFVEFFIALAFLSWLSSRLPFAVRISGDYCRRLSAFILSPTSIFLLGNAIVVTLLAKSGLFSAGASSSVDNAVAEFYEELRSENPEDQLASPNLLEEVVYQDKEIICEVKENRIENNPKVIDDGYGSDKVKYRRCQSEKFRMEITEEEHDRGMNEKLRRSEMDIRRRNIAGGGESAEVFPEDDLSSKEFRRTIEAFIARQVRFHREERLAVVLHGQA